MQATTTQVRHEPIGLVADEPMRLRLELATLARQTWSHVSGCDGWSTARVVAHLAAGAERWRTVALLAIVAAVLQHAPADAAHHPPIAPAPELATTFTGPASCAAGGFLSGDTVGDANPADLFARLCGRAGDRAGTDAQD